MRDKRVHDYFETDYETIWLTVEEDIPELKEHITRILSATGNQD